MVILRSDRPLRRPSYRGLLWDRLSACGSITYLRPPSGDPPPHYRTLSENSQHARGFTTDEYAISDNMPDMPKPKRRVTEARIIAWARAHRNRHGHWPSREVGRVREAPELSWSKIDDALSRGLRGLSGGSSLAQLLDKAFHRKRREQKAPLQISQILYWAKKHHRRTGRWPTALAGRVRGAPEETWVGINSALEYGCRGFSGGSSLARQLDRAFGRNRDA